MFRGSGGGILLASSTDGGGGTDWPQVFVQAAGIIVAGLIAIYLSSWQHRAQVLHEARREVSRAMTIVGEMDEHFIELGSAQIPADDGRWQLMSPDLLRSSHKELQRLLNDLHSQSHLLALTAPHDMAVAIYNVYDAANNLVNETRQINLRLSIDEEERAKGRPNHELGKFSNVSLHALRTVVNERVLELIEVSRIPPPAGLRYWLRWAQRFAARNLQGH